jgi:hypothetical protein
MKDMRSVPPTRSLMREIHDPGDVLTLWREYSTRGKFVIRYHAFVRKKYHNILTTLYLLPCRLTFSLTVAILSGTLSLENRPTVGLMLG